MVGIFSAFVLLLLLSPMEASAAAQGSCRRLLGDERAACLGLLYERTSRKNFDALAKAWTASSSSSSSSSEIPVSYPDAFQMGVEADPQSIPEGMSCIRFDGLKRVRCQQRELARVLRGGSPDARGVVRIESSGASASSMRPLSSRKHCMRLPEAGRRRECLIEYRSGIAAGTKDLR